MTSQKTGGQEDFFRDTEMEKDDSSLNRGPDVDDQEREGKQAAEQGEAERQDDCRQQNPSPVYFTMS